MLDNLFQANLDIFVLAAVIQFYGNLKQSDWMRWGKYGSILSVWTDLQVKWAEDAAGVSEALGQIHTLRLGRASAASQSTGVHVHLTVFPWKSCKQ